MTRWAMDRREAIKHTLIACGGAAVGVNLLSGCAPNPPPCPVGSDPGLSWGPSVLAPVFYGYADYGASVGAPTNVRVYYPSLDGSPQDAPFVYGPGLFPLVIFLHGHCSESLHYTRWSLLPAILARSGFVVAIPDLSPNAPWDLGDSTYTGINATLSWMRSGWPHQAFLMPSVLGIVGHSYGALYGGQLATTIPATAYVSLSGGWTEWPSVPPQPLDKITVPKLLAWGTNEVYPALSQTHWDRLSHPKYRLRFKDGEHWDYVPSSTCASQTGTGPCNVVPALAADITTLFLSKFMPPDGVDLHIGENLLWPSHPLTTEQQFFIGGHMQSFQMMAARPSCHADLSWTTSGQPGARALP